MKRSTMLAVAVLLASGGVVRADSPEAVRAGRAGVTALVNNQYKTALDSLTRAVALAPDNPLWRLNLAWTYLALNRPADALKAFDDAAKRIKRNETGLTFPSWVLWGKALAYEKMGNCPAMAKALATWMSLVMDKNVTGRLHGTTKKMIEAQIKVARQKIRECPNRVASSRRK